MHGTHQCAKKSKISATVHASAKNAWGKKKNKKDQNATQTQTPSIQTAP